MSTSTPARTTRRAVISTQQRTMLIMLLVPGSIVVVLMASMMFGQVSGNEFCPQDFAYRSFRFNQIPFIQIQITPVYRNDKTNDLVKYLTTSKLLPGTTEKIRWDLTDGHRGQFAMATSGAEILQRYLSASDSQSSFYWKQWSVRRPEEAKVLWPVVAKLARVKQYPLVPEAFETAKVAVDEKNLASLLATRIAPQLHERALFASQDKRPDEARALWDLALDLDPSQAEWRSLRDALPPPEKVETSRSEASTKESPTTAPVKDSQAKDSNKKEATTQAAPVEESSSAPEKTAPEKDVLEKDMPEKTEPDASKPSEPETSVKPEETKPEPTPAYQSTPTSDATKNDSPAESK